MLNISPANIFPLKYPKTDLTLPSHGAKVVPVIINYSGDNACSINLLDVQTQKDFESLRCVWIDTRDCAQSVLVEVAGTGQRFAVPANAAGYYPLIVLNNPLIVFTVANPTSDSVRVMFLNFVPRYALQSTPGGGAGGNVTVDNFPAVQNILPLNAGTSITTTSFKDTSKVGIIAATQTLLCGITVQSTYAVNSGGSVIFTLYSGNGASVLNLQIPVSASTPGQLNNVIALQNLAIPLINNGGNVSAKLSSALTSGSIYVAIVTSQQVLN